MANTNNLITAEIKTKEIIKPSSPTPPHLSTLKLSLLDQITFDLYFPFVFFYHGNNVDTHQRSQSLKYSLSQVLTHFYPLAGRINEDGTTIDCNDQGIDYFETQVSNCTLYDVLKQPDIEVLRKLCPTDVESPSKGNGCLLIVQVNFFECGGLAIGLSFSHKLQDASSFACFVKSWATINRDDELLVPPEFNAAYVLPKADTLIKVSLPPLNNDKNAQRRFVFEGGKLKQLKSKIFSEGGLKQPSRVEAVSALIWKCAMVASKYANNGVLKPSTLTHSTNLRKRMVPPLSENSIGNFAVIFVTQNKNENIEVPTLATELRRKMEEFNFECKKKLGGVEASSFILGSTYDLGDYQDAVELNSYACSSWCRFPLYEVDFGWGKPNWVSSVMWQEAKNMIVLMDTKEDDGIEAWVTLCEEHMAFFEQDPDLLAFACLNPSVVW